MRFKLFLSLAGLLVLTGCASHGQKNELDPLEPINRATFKFNRAYDATILKPVAKLYTFVLPQFVRDGINNAYNNLAMIPTVGNDLLQFEFRYAIKDTWRFAINSTFGFAGVRDVASGSFGLPEHYNDFGTTLYKLGYKKSSYLMVPFLGPTTTRDAIGMTFDYFTMTPFPYIDNRGLVWGFWGLRYVDLRSQLFEQERLMDEAIDPYTFVRDAWFQHREYLINGQNQVSDTPSGTETSAKTDKTPAAGSEQLGGDYVD